MSKKSTTDAEETVFSARDFEPKRKKRLDIKQIRSYAEKLRAWPDDGFLPDWRGLSIGDRFAIVLRLIPADQQSTLLGKSEGHIRRYERGVDIPLTVVAALAAETEVPMEWIVHGESMLRRPVTQLEPWDPETLREFQEHQAGYASPTDVPVKKLAFKVAAGRGEMILDETADAIRFPKMILEGLGVSPRHARLMEASGESMKSTINDGDLMLVDVSPAARDIVEGKIYVFAISDEAYVKRLRRTGGVVVMISDNREMFPPEEVPKDAPLRIFGRVMWAGRNL